MSLSLLQSYLRLAWQPWHIKEFWFVDAKISSMQKKIVQFWSLSQHERMLLIQTVICLMLTHWGIRWLGLHRWYRFLQRPSSLKNLMGSSAQTTERQTEQTIAASVQTVMLAVRYGICAGNCLSRSLTLWWLLHRQGIECELRIGVRIKEGRLQAHAWVEYQKEPVNETYDVHQRYAAFSDVQNILRSMVLSETL